MPYGKKLRIRNRACWNDPYRKESTKLIKFRMDFGDAFVAAITQCAGPLGMPGYKIGGIPVRRSK